MTGGLEKTLLKESISIEPQMKGDIGNSPLERVKPNETVEPLEKRAHGIIENPDIDFIERTSRNALIEQNGLIASSEVATGESLEGAVGNTTDEPSREVTSETKEDDGLTEEEKARIKEETGWSDEIIDNIKNMDQYEVLKNAGLIEVEINGRKCLIKENIDLDYTDADGISNRDRIARGRAPLDSKTGKPIQLHHLGQNPDSPLVELTEEEHRTGEYKDGAKNQTLWHDNTRETTVHGEGNTWKKEREDHWKTRATTVSGGVA